MPGSGGNTTQSGIIFQNSIAALCLGRMLDPRDCPDTDRPVEVRVEAPTAVDDTVVRFIDGHRGFIQAKERIQTGSEDWKTLWRHFEEQCSYPDFAVEDRLILWLGEDNSQSKGLRDICKQAAGATGYEEWHGGLSKGKQEQAEKVRMLLEKQENETLFTLLKQVDIETARSLEEIERDLVPSWLPECNDQGGYFAACAIFVAGRSLQQGDHAGFFARGELLKKGFDIGLLAKTQRPWGPFQVPEINAPQSLRSANRTRQGSRGGATARQRPAGRWPERLTWAVAASWLWLRRWPEIQR